MKKIILLFSLIFVLQITGTPLKAQLQESTGEIIFNAILGGVFNLLVQDGDVQTATFNTADDYNDGVSESIGVPGIDPGYSTIAMEATGNWYLKISAPDFLPISGGSGSIPIDNVGVWCEATGVHQFGTEVTCAYQTADNALGLQNADATLIDLGSNNSGSSADNLFVLHWLMGTKQGTMNPLSMFEQLTSGLFSQGTYSTIVLLTMTEIP